MSGLYGRNRSTAHADAVIVATHDHNFFPGFGRSFDRVFFSCESNAAGKHYDLVVGVETAVFIVLERQQRTADQWLTEFVSEIRCSVRSLYEDVAGGLIEPYPRIAHEFPAVIGAHAGIGSHIDGRSRNRKRCAASAESVADFSAGSCGSSVERLHCRWEIVGFRFERYDGVDGAHVKQVGPVGIFRRKLLDTRALDKGHIVFIGGYESVGVFLRGLFYEFEQRKGLFLSVDNESAVENFMTAMLGIDLGETENFAVGQRTSEFVRETTEILLFILAQGEAF